MTASTVPFKEHDTVVLVRDVPEAGLRVGDLGAVVFVYAPDTFEVEFVKPAGGTQALLTLSAQDLRAVRDDEVLAVRSAATTRGAA